MPKHTVIDRIANEGGRAIVKVIEGHTGKSMPLYGAMQVVRRVGDAFYAMDLVREQIADRNSILLDEVKVRESSPISERIQQAKDALTNAYTDFVIVARKRNGENEVIEIAHSDSDPVALLDIMEDAEEVIMRSKP